MRKLPLKFITKPFYCSAAIVYSKWGKDVKGEMGGQAAGIL